MPRVQRYTKEQIVTALSLYNKLKSMPKVVELLGYPSVTMLWNWKRMYPEITASHKHRKHRKWIRASIDIKLNAIRRCIDNGEMVKSIAEDIGYSSVAVWQWIKKYTEEGYISLMNQSNSNRSNNPKNTNSKDDIDALKAQMLDMQMEIDILKETINVLKKDPGINLETLTNREKVVIIDALKHKYSLPKLCRKLHISRSSYYYQESVMRAKDKYCTVRKRICTLFHDNYDAFGYRKIYTLLKKEGIILSEKVIRRIMREEQLIVKKRRHRKYNSYKGEITPAVDNLIKRNFHANKPNTKWLTDITEFSIKAGKVYLSPIIDCFDGMPVCWTVGTSPNADLANTMLKCAISTLKPDEHPIIHSDRGCHYRWPEWIQITEKAGLTRSMSKKGCSPDNSACEGFFGHMKMEMFYGRDWSNSTLDDLIQAINEYMDWYCTSRIKSTLGGLSPLEYRRRLGVGV